MNKIEFEILAKAAPKERPRAFVSKGQTQFYTPEKTKDFEKLVGWSANRAMLTHKQPIITSAVTLKIIFQFKKPKNLKDMSIAHIKRPDLSNLIKSVEDGMNKIVYQDDSQINEINATKKYGESDKIIIAIYF